ETLAVDALANALGPVFRAGPSPTRIAVAMSGGVDSAVALLRSLPDAVGVTLRLWLDPEGPDSERACCSPDSVIAARETCHRRRAAPGEPGGVLPRGRRLSELPRPARPCRRRGRHRRRERKRPRPTRRLLAFHARSAARSRRRVAGAALRPRQPSSSERRRRR